MRRKLLLVGLLVCLGSATLFVVLWATGRGQAVRREAYERIQDGMTQSQVEALLGGPPGDYRTGEVYCDPDVGTFFLLDSKDVREESWKGDEGTAVVTFDRNNGKVVVKKFLPGELLPMGPLDRLLWLLGRWGL